MPEHTRQRLTWRNRSATRPDTTDIYPEKMNHGWEEPLAGGTDVMRRVQNEFRREQGLPERPDSPKVASVREPFEALLDAALDFGLNTRRGADKKLASMASQVEKLVDDINTHLAADEQGE